MNVDNEKAKKNKRLNRLVFRVFCEGDTEYHYFEEFRKNKAIKLAIKPINMTGGGYSNFLSLLRQDGNTNCLAKFIVVDGDKAFSDINERKKLVELIDYCVVQNDSRRIPHILIVNFPDFEYCACLHSTKYKGQDIKSFIENEYKYKDLDAFKRDKSVFNVLNSRGNSYDVMIKAINKQNALITNSFTINKKKYEIDVTTRADYSRLGKKGTNFGDFFLVIGKFDNTI